LEKRGTSATSKSPFDQYFEHIDPLADMFDISTIAEASKSKRKPPEIT